MNSPDKSSLLEPILSRDASFNLIRSPSSSPELKKAASSIYDIAPMANDDIIKEYEVKSGAEISNQIAQRYEKPAYDLLFEKTFDRNIKLIAVANLGAIAVITYDDSIYYLDKTKDDFIMFKTDDYGSYTAIYFSLDGTTLYLGTKTGFFVHYDLKNMTVLKALKISDSEVRKISFFTSIFDGQQYKTVVAIAGENLIVLRTYDYQIITEMINLEKEVYENIIDINIFEGRLLSLLSKVPNGKRRLKVFNDTFTDTYIDFLPSSDVISFHFDRSFQMIQVRDGKIGFIDDPKRYSNIDGGDSSLERIFEISGVHKHINCDHNRIISITDGNIVSSVMMPRLIVKEYKDNIFTEYPPNIKFDLKAYEIYKVPYTRKYILKTSQDQIKVIGFRHISEKIIDTKIPNIIKVVISPDGSYTAFSSENGKIVVWNKDGPYTIFEDVHSDVVYSLVFSKDNNTLLTSSFDLSIKLLNLKEKTVAKEILEAHDSEIRQVAFSKDESIFVSCSEFRDIKIWDTKSGGLISTIENPNPNFKITIFAISPDNETLVVSFGDHSVKVWNIKTNEIIRDTSNVFYNQAIYMSISDDNKYVTTITNTGRIRLTEIISNISPDELLTTETYVTAATLSAQNNLALLVDLDSIYLFDPKKRSLISIFQDTVDNYGASIALAPSGKYFIVTKNTSEVSIYHFSQHIKMNENNAHIDEIRGLCMTCDEKYVISKSTDGWMKMWDYKSQTIVYELETDMNECIASANCHSYIAYSAEAEVIIWDYETKSELFSISLNTNANDLAFSETDEYLIMGDWNGKIIIFRMDDRTQEFILNAHIPGQIRVLAFEDLIISAGYHDIKLWKRDTREMVVRFKNVHKDTIASLDIARRRRFFVSGSGDKSIKVWSLDTWHLVHDFQNAHESYIDYVGFSKDENYIISSGDDLAIKIWNVHIMTLMYTFNRAHKDMIYACVLSSDNKHLVSSSNDGVVKFTEVNIPKEYVYIPGMDCLFSTLKPTFESNLQMIIFPQAWNVLHYFTIINPKLLFTVPKDFNVTFILDSFNKTPIHYLKHTTDDSYDRYYNHIFIIILNFLERTIKSDFFTFQKTMIALSPMLLELFHIVYSANLKRFLKLCFGDAQPYFGQLLDNYIGSPNPKPLVLDSPVIRNDELSQLFTKGHDKISFKLTHMPVDFDIRSDMIYHLLKFLEKEKRRYFIESPFITAIIDKLWQDSKHVETFNLTLFSLLIISLIFSVSNIGNEGQEIYELIALGFTIFWLGYKVYQIRIFGKKYYFAQRWNLVDFSCLIPMTVLLSLSLVGYLDPSEDIVAIWLYIISIIFAFLRMIWYLRIIDSTRNLIRTIIKIITDMRSFSLIVGVILIGFCGTLMAVNYLENNFVNNLYASYFMLFGPQKGLSDTTEQILSLIYPFVLNLVFINMLINIMGDSFDEIHEQKKYTDNKERIELISEACIVLRHFKGSTQMKLKCLIKAVDEDDIEEDIDEKVEEVKHSLHKLEEKFNDFKKSSEENLKAELKEQEERLKKRFIALEEKITKNSKENQDIQAFLKDMFQKQASQQEILLKETQDLKVQINLQSQSQINRLQSQITVSSSSLKDQIQIEKADQSKKSQPNPSSGVKTQLDIKF